MMPLGAKLGISYHKFSLIYTLFDNYPHVCHHKKLESACDDVGSIRNQIAHMGQLQISSRQQIWFGNGDDILMAPDLLAWPFLL